MLTVPLRELYAVLWRAGIVEIGDRSAADVSRR
ncbi:MAG TPA: Rv1535 domain-containing protein [Mycobacterium sp.]